MKKLEYIKDIFLLIVFSIAYGVKVFGAIIYELIKKPFKR
jgi:hypothetical protein